MSEGKAGTGDRCSGSSKVFNVPSVLVKKELRRKVYGVGFTGQTVSFLTYSHELWIMTERTRSQTQASERVCSVSRGLS